MTIEKKICWEKYYDEPPDSEEKPEVQFQEDNDDLNMLIMGPTVIRTPIGEYIKGDNFIPTKMFNCWIGHTNFDITEDKFLMIEETEGVEVCRIISRYRFFIGVGKMFEFKEVGKKIQSSLFRDKIVKSSFFIDKDGTYEFLCSDKSNLAAYNAKINSLKKIKGGQLVIIEE